MASPAPVAISFSWSRHGIRLLVACGALISILAWSYWPTMTRLVEVWIQQPDYSHGFFVVPLAGMLLVVRRNRFPGMSASFGWGGLVLIVTAFAVRIIGEWAYLEAADAWSMPIWIAGAVWLLCGWRMLWWAMPAVLFLFFMIPLPFQAEQQLSFPLQTIATHASVFLLQLVGQPAVAQGHVILLDEERLEVAQACAGLRIFVSVLALTFVTVVLMRRNWWERGAVILAAVPIALSANALRIVATGLLIQFASSEAARSFSHDFAGYAMIAVAAGLFGLLVLYLRWLVRESAPVDAHDMIHRKLEVASGAN